MIHVATIVLVSLKLPMMGLARTGSAGIWIAASGAPRNPNPNASPSAPPSNAITKITNAAACMSNALGPRSNYEFPYRFSRP